MNVGARLTELRNQQGITTNRLANLCGLSQSFVRSVELGEKGITVDNLSLLCDALGISLADFFAEPENDDLLDKQLNVCISSLSVEKKKALLLLLSKI